MIIEEKLHLKIKPVFKVIILIIAFIVAIGMSSDSVVENNSPQVAWIPASKTQSQNQVKEDNRQQTPSNTNNQKIEQPPAPEIAKTLEEKVTDAINTSLGSKTNMGKQRVVSIEVDKYNIGELSTYKYKSGEPIVGLFIKINSSENVTTNLQKATMDKEATEIAKAVFPIDNNIGDILIWSQLPIKDQYGNVKDDTAIVFSISRTLFNKINWVNFDYHDLPALLKSEKRLDDRNSYFENVTF